MKSGVKGIHHITSVSGKAAENFHFYTQVLGLRLVKKTVNFDDPGVYHLYYGDRTGSPGTLMTFFPYGGPRARKGAGQVAASAYAVKELQWWNKRLLEHGVEVSEEIRFGIPYLLFEDPHGMSLELYEDLVQGEEFPTRLRGASLELSQVGPTRELLEFLGFELEAEEGCRTRLRLPGGGDYLDLLASERLPATGGAGSVHHIALRVSDDTEQQEWLSALRKAGFAVSSVRDRTYFHSIYFRGPGGVLFELATDPPGMLIDESEEALGTHLMLPSQYEAHRQQIEARLEPLSVSTRL